MATIAKLTTDGNSLHRRTLLERWRLSSRMKDKLGIYFRVARNLGFCWRPRMPAVANWQCHLLVNSLQSSIEFVQGREMDAMDWLQNLTMQIQAASRVALAPVFEIFNERLQAAVQLGLNNR